MIQNARDKILGDRSLQEKLAENINKILARCEVLSAVQLLRFDGFYCTSVAIYVVTSFFSVSFCFILNLSDPMPQTAKASSSTVEADQSIDEILGLQVPEKLVYHN